MKHRVLQFTIAFLGGLALTLVLALLSDRATLVQADPAVLYVAPGENCNGAGPCYGSVQAAVDNAAHGDEIRVAAGTYTGVNVRPRNDVTTTGVVTQVVYISKSITIQGGYTTTNWTMPDPDANPATLDAQEQGRVLYITGDISPTIEGLHITGGDSAGLGGSSYGDMGGGVYIITATATISNNRVFSNTARRNGGGLYLRQSDATLQANIVTTNTADHHGGGLALNDIGVTLTDNTISGNTASYDGGGLAIDASNSTLTGNIISGNDAGDDGGGVYLFRSGAMLTGNTIISNTATGFGGGVVVHLCDDITLTGNTVMSNITGEEGGGLILINSDATLANTVIAGNRASTAGSGLYIVASSAQLLHLTIARNTGGDGSGVYLDSDNTVALTNTILVSHSVGISVTGGNSVTVNGTLWHNTPVTVSQAVTAVVMVQNQYQGNPVFVDPDGGDYHIGATSAAVDVGIETGVTMDIDGEARPFNIGPDLGADERATVGTTAESATASAITAMVGGLTTTVQIPTGAVTESTALTYTALAITGQGNPPGFSFANHAFDLDAYRDGSLLSGFTFSVPVTITLHYTDADIAGLDEDALVLEYWNGSAWVDAACGDYDHHPNENWLAVPICHLSRFALFGEREYAIYLPLVLRNYQ